MAHLRTNPFHYGSPAAGEYFADREDELRDVVHRMLNAGNVILLSPRRYGKTSLLFAATSRVRDGRGRTGYVSLLRCTSPRDVAETLLNGVLNGPLSWLSSQQNRLADLLSRLRLAPSISFQPSGDVRVSVGAASAETQWQTVLGDVLRLLKQASEGKRPVSFVLDEFQRVVEIDPSLAGVFKGLADELSDVSLVLCGSKLHLMRQLTATPAAPLFDMGERIHLGKVPETAMVGFLMARAEEARKPMTEGAARLIFAAVDGIPNDVQRLAYEAFFLAERKIDTDTVQAAIERVVAHRSAEYEDAFARLAPVQQRLLRSLACRPRASLYARAFMNELEVANSNAVRKALDVLAEHELVAQHGQDWMVTDAFYRRWLAAE